MKRILSVLAVICAFIPAYAQNSIGIKGGLNLSDYHAHDVSKSNIRVGYHGGLYARLSLTGFLSLQTEALYETKGSCLEYDNGQVKGMANFNLNYIDVPFLAVFSLSHRYSIHAGPYFGILSNVMIENESSDTETFDFENEVSRDNFHKVDMGLAAGIEAAFARLGIGIRYNYGISPVGKEKIISGQPVVFPDATNRLFQVYLAVRIL
jgi:hypothetical protein